MSAARPSILLTGKIPSSVLAKLESIGEVDQFRKDGVDVMPHDELVARVAGKQALDCREEQESSLHPSAPLEGQPAPAYTAIFESIDACPHVETLACPEAVAVHVNQMSFSMPGPVKKLQIASF